MAEYFEMQNEETSIISYDISVIPNDFNVMTINSLIESGVISMPAFQRNYVWDRKRASRFIESLILGLPVPQIFLYQMDRNKYLSLIHISEPRDSTSSRMPSSA